MAFNFLKFLVDVDLTGNKLLNVADGTAGTDGVNLAQIEALILDYDSAQTIWMGNPGDDLADGLNPKDAVEDIEVAIDLANALTPSGSNVIEIKERDSGAKTLTNSKTLDNFVNVSMGKSGLFFNGGDLTIDGGNVLDFGALVGIGGNRVYLYLEDANRNTTIRANSLITEADVVFGQATTAASTPDLFVYIDKIEITDMVGDVFDWPWASNLNIICDTIMMDSTDALGSHSFVSATGGGNVRIYANTVVAKSSGGGQDIVFANVQGGSNVTLYAQELDVDQLYNVDATSTFIYQYSTFAESTPSVAAGGAVIDRIALLSDIPSGGGISVVTKIAGDSPYSAVDGEVVLCNAGAGAITVTLPAAASNADAQITVKKIDNGVNAVTVDGNGAETIDDATTAVIGTQFESITLVCDGSNWHII
jgi:hypothetical protein